MTTWPENRGWGKATELASAVMKPLWSLNDYYFLHGVEHERFYYIDHVGPRQFRLTVHCVGCCAIKREYMFKSFVRAKERALEASDANRYLDRV